MNTVEQRLASIEASLRRWRRGTLGLAVAFGLLTIVAAQPPGPPRAPDLIRAQRFEVVDDDGNTLLTLRANKSGNGLLESFTKDGQRLALITSNDRRNGVVGVYNPKGDWVTALTADEQGRGELAVFASEQKMIVRVGANTRGDGSVLVRAPAAEQAAAALSLNERRDGILEIWNSRGQRVVVAAADSSGQGVLQKLNP